VAYITFLEPLGTGWLTWRRRCYRMMIVTIIGLMLLHNGSDLFRRWSDQRAHGAAAPPAGAADRMYLRFTLNERVQHWTLASSFIVLAVTGFALKFKWSMPWVSAQGAATIRGQAHRIAAVTFMGLALYHLGYLLLSQRGRKTIRDMLPNLKRVANVCCCLASCIRLGPPSTSDWRDLIANVKYNLGLSRVRPRFGRFSYIEKMEYLALVWGAVVMIGTGLALWFEVPFLNRFPFWSFELATVVHYYEAALATLAILVWHFYFTVFNPDVFPVSKAMITGKLNREQMESEYPLELEESEGGAQGANDVTSRAAPGDSAA
jgi:cytochrome b subunit of formate dehydrogenase